MIKRTVEISEQAVHLSVKNDQLVLTARGVQRSNLASIPIEDIGLVLVEHTGTTYTHAVLATLLRHDGALVVCGRDHMPAGLLLPLGEHTQVVWRIRDQLAVRKPLKKQLWRQIVRAKIEAQARNLEPGSAGRRRLVSLARQVRSGDTTNVEAQAARAYWSAWLPGEAFRRDPDGHGINALLNYGYAVMRAAVARALVAAGLLPVLGIHHCGRGNAFCLADDLMEPLRPLVDGRVRTLANAGIVEVNPQGKKGLLELLAEPVECGGQTGPLLVAFHRMVASLVRCFEGSDRRLEIAVARNEEGACRKSEAVDVGS